MDVLLPGFKDREGLFWPNCVNSGVNPWVDTFWKWLRAKRTLLDLSGSGGSAAHG